MQGLYHYIISHWLITLTIAFKKRKDKLLPLSNYTGRVRDIIITEFRIIRNH